jgi:hypothetical protein
MEDLKKHLTAFRGQVKTFYTKKKLKPLAFYGTEFTYVSASVFMANPEIQ